MSLPMELLDEDTRVVQDALAFIDAFYSSPADEDISFGAAGELLDEESASLREALDNLQGQLVAATPMQIIHNDTDESEPVRNQELQFIEQSLRRCQRLWRELLGNSRAIRVTPLRDASAAMLLRRRLDEITTHVASGASERSLFDGRLMVEEISDKYFAQRADGVAVRFQSGRYIPFKLSILAPAAWSVVVDSTFGNPGMLEAGALRHRDELVMHLNDERYGTNGPVALRRAQLPDGSILICWTGFTPAYSSPECDPEDPTAGCETHEFGWVRVGRQFHEATNQPRVYIESVNDVVSRRTRNEEREPSPALVYRRHEQFMRRMVELSDRDADKNRKLLENRMLDATLGSSRLRQLNVSSIDR